MLTNSKSLYLRQHAANPVHWQEFNEETLKRASGENRLVIVSIGYSACHWCHVMEHETFSDEEVAQVMNSNFVCIKVDREERPDIDHQYMAAVQLISGNGGWPLNCITLPDGRPVFGGTYFRRDDWITLLQRISMLWKESPGELERYAAQITDSVSGYEHIRSDMHDREFGREHLMTVAESLHSMIDQKNGGTKGAPKFPIPPMIRLLFQLTGMEIAHDSAALALLTLDKMQQGGIHDHLGGGFARYSVDNEWRIPHFEKMLYDNAQLLGLYSHAFAISGNGSFRNTAYGILNFLYRDMKAGNGGFYAAIDADSEGEEGRYYTWTAVDIITSLGNDAGLFMQYFNCKHEGNFESGRNILFTLQQDEELWKSSDVSPEEGRQIIGKSREVLLRIRKDRVPPVTDTKQITSWNALLVSSLVEMGITFGDEKVMKSASDLMDTILKYSLSEDGTLLHLFGAGDSVIAGFLDDYASVILALTDLYSANFEMRYLDRAEALISHVINHFADEKSGLFYYVSDDRHFPVARKMELHDHVIPSSNAMMAKALYRMAFYRGNEKYNERALRMVGNMIGSVTTNPASHGEWAQVAVSIASPGWEITVSGKGAAEAAREISRKRHPGMLVKVSEVDSPGVSEIPDSSLTIIPCKNRTCYAPLTNPEELFLFLKTDAE